LKSYRPAPTRDKRGRQGLNVMRNGLDQDVGKSGGSQIVADFSDIVIAVRCARHEGGRIVRQERRHGVIDGLCKFIFVQTVPDVEEETPERAQHAASLAVALDLVRKEHDAELAGDGIKAVSFERQRQRIGLSPCDAPLKIAPARGAIQHRLVEIGCDDPALRRQARCGG
jgi:hypothetical protein